MKVHILELVKDGLQTRTALDEDTVDEYAEAMRDGARFPPVKVFTSCGKYWLADGFHRVEAAGKIGQKSIEADVTEGGFINALEWALNCNAKHGKRVTNADKQNAMRMAWEHRQELFGGNPSAGALAAKCGVSKPTASKFIHEHDSFPSDTIEILIADIVADKGVLARAKLDEETVADYAAAIGDGETFPPIKAFDIGGEKLVVTDGWHRLEAARRAGRDEIMAEVRIGSRIDAIRESLVANIRHGVRLTNADKRKNLETAWEKRVELFGGTPTSGQLAEVCGVHRNTALNFLHEKEAGVRQ